VISLPLPLWRFSQQQLKGLQKDFVRAAVHVAGQEGWGQTAKVFGLLAVPRFCAETWHFQFVLQEQLRSIKKELGLEKDDKSALIQKCAFCLSRLL